MYLIENEFLAVCISPKGAELISITHKKQGINYVWDADPAFWGKSSPVLFPIVGGLKDNTYFFEGKAYTLPRHGFAREAMFELEEHADEGICLLLRSNEDTLKVYPFKFELRLIYELYGNVLSLTYHVTNTGQNDLYFSVGGHPAFAVPLEKGLTYDDYFLEFEEEEYLNRWPLNAEGLVLDEAIPIFPDAAFDEDGDPTTGKIIPLSKALFYQDALVFKQLASKTITLKSEKSKHALTFDFAGFPFLGIWAAKNANFVCIEPWCGIADSASHNQELSQKEGINQLPAGEIFERAWAVKLT